MATEQASHRGPQAEWPASAVKSLEGDQCRPNLICDGRQYGHPRGCSLPHGCALGLHMLAVETEGGVEDRGHWFSRLARGLTELHAAANTVPRQSVTLVP